MRNIYGVKFKPNGKIYHFNAEKLECPINVTVIVRTERGEQFGKVVMKVNETDLKTSIEEISPIIRIATKNDYKKHLSLLKEQEEAMNYAKEIANELNLNMRFMDSSFTFDRKQLLLNFLADERIDFRELAKRMASKFKARIELRQIGARDKAKSIDGYGVCGRRLCCAGFLNHIDSISMNMAKNQNIALNPSKINGCCGRLLCCLTYEDEQYSCCRVGMPTVGKIVTLEQGEGKVISVDILNRKYKVLIGNEVKEIELDNNESSKE